MVVSDDRQRAILDAAIDLLAERGARGLTHRACDALADLPEGSTSNHYRSRDALLAAILRRILERDAGLWADHIASAVVTSAEQFAEVLARLTADLTGSHRHVALARHAILAEAAAHRELAAEIDSARAEIVGWFAPVLGSLGSPDPETHARWLLALIDGLSQPHATQHETLAEYQAPIHALLTQAITGT